jgi:hypothetical protein
MTSLQKRILIALAVLEWECPNRGLTAKEIAKVLKQRPRKAAKSAAGTIQGCLSGMRRMKNRNWVEQMNPGSNWDDRRWVITKKGLLTLTFAAKNTIHRRSWK